jgi:dTDP-4-dehydrorhamnose 3,5-epimerase
MKLQDYSNTTLIEGVKVWRPKSFKDCGGEFREIARFQKRYDDHYGSDPYIEMRDGSGEDFYFDLKQMNVSTLEPGAIKAFHLHKKQTDLWYVMDKMIVVLVAPDRQYSRLVLENEFVLIPPGVLHGIANPYSTRGRMMYLTDEYFDPNDEWREDPFLVGKEVWQIQAG